MKREQWKNVIGFTGRYEVSNAGRIRSIFPTKNKLPVPRLLKGTVNKDGYIQVTLRTSRGLQVTQCIHTMVAERFLKRPKWTEEVNHKSGSKRNNLATQLEWTTSKGNGEHAAKLGLTASGERNGRALLTRRQVGYIIRNRGRISQRVLAGMFGVSRSCIGHICVGNNWVAKGSFTVSGKKG